MNVSRVIVGEVLELRWPQSSQSLSDTERTTANQVASGSFGAMTIACGVWLSYLVK